MTNSEPRKIKNSRKLIIYSIAASLIILVALLSVNTQAVPSSGDSHSLCHPGSGVVISTTSEQSLQANPSSKITIAITATGVSAIRIFSEDLADLTITPGTTINDGDAEDTDTDANEIAVSIEITVPDTVKVYTIQIVAKDTGGVPVIDFIEFTINVGGAIFFDLGAVFDHLGLWLGLPALILLAFGTILVLKNESKYVKYHGIFAGTALILTIINVISLIKIPLGSWSAYPVISHWPHMILGGAGLVAGFLSMLFGIAAERKNAKITGYLALICWTGAFVLGFLYLS